MKRKLIIFSSLITLLLACFSFPIYADEDIEDIEELAQVDLPDYALDQYFYDNYVLLPYIESYNSQSINTGLTLKDSYRIDCQISDVSRTTRRTIFSNYENSSGIGAYYLLENDQYRLYLGSSSSQLINTDFLPYNLVNIRYEDYSFYINGLLAYDFQGGNIDSGKNIFIFSTPSLSNYGYFKLYRFQIYDASLNEGEGGYVRYYYPAKSKASGIIGLYDSVSKTFITTGGSVPFNSPLNDQVISFQISDFLESSLDWIEAIFLAFVEMPIIIVFMAIGLAGAMFRWGRRIIHF